MKTVLLVGATGFVGQHLEVYYRQQGWQVLTLGRHQFSDFVFDGNDLNSIVDLPLPADIDRVVHVIAVNETQIHLNLAQAYHINVSLTRLLLEMAKKHQIGEFIYLSTFHVYGKGEGDINEQTVIEPKNDYGLSHYLSERIVSDLGQVFGLKTLIVRPTNVYGVPVDMTTFNRWTLVPFAFVRSAVQDSDIAIRSSGLQARNFVSVQDVCKATELVGKYTVVNAYGLDTLTIRDFALKVAEEVGKQMNKTCAVRWVGNSSSAVVARLNVSTLCEAYRPQQQIDTYLHEFTGMLVK